MRFFGAERTIVIPSTTDKAIMRLVERGIELDTGDRLEFDRGKKDHFCVYHTPPGGARYAPRDVKYFNELNTLALGMGAERVYQDFCTIYDMTGSDLDLPTVSQVRDIAQGYGQHAHLARICFFTLYMAMIAEENFANTRLGKRIKRLGVHQVLVEGMPVDQAADYSRSMPWRDIDRECRSRGF